MVMIMVMITILINDNDNDSNDTPCREAPSSEQYTTQHVRCLYEEFARLAETRLAQHTLNYLKLVDIT